MNSMAPNRPTRAHESQDDVSLVLLVEDNPGDAEIVSLYLQEASKSGIVVEKAFSLADAVRALQRKPYAAVILDLGLPDAQGMQTIKGIRAVAKDLPIIVLSGIQDRLLSSEAIRHGAVEFLQKDTLSSSALTNSVLVAIERTKQQRKSVPDEYVDPLTGLYNRVGLLTVVESVYELASNSDTEFAIFYIMITRESGEQVSEELVVESAKLIECSFRSSDTIARLNDAEFVLVINDAREDQLWRISSRIMDQFRFRNNRSDVKKQLAICVGRSRLNRVQPNSVEDMIAEAKSNCRFGPERSQ